jgi:hypothetical protein
MVTFIAPATPSGSSASAPVRGPALREGARPAPRCRPGRAAAGRRPGCAWRARCPEGRRGGGVAAGHGADRPALSGRRLRRAFAGGSGWLAIWLTRARIVVSEVSRCSRSSSARVLIAWAMTAWRAGSC